MMLVRTLRLSLKFSLFCFCALLSIRSHSQICTSQVYTNRFDLGPPNGEFVLPLPGGGTIFGGRYFYDWTQVGIVKTTPDGNIVYNKRIDGFDPPMNPSVACLTNDKNVLIGVRTGLVLVDTNGVVLRSAVTTVNFGEVFDLKTDATGNIYALYEATGAMPQQKWVVIKITSDLSTVLWSAAFGTDYSSGYSSILVNGDRVFAVGSFPTSQSSNNVGSVLCFNANNGSLLKQVALTVNGYECHFNTMHRTDNGYLLEGYFIPYGQSYFIYNHIIVRLTDLLQPVKGARFTTVYNTDPLFIKPDDAGGFYACAGSAGVNFFHCDRQDSVTWSRLSINNLMGPGAFAMSATNLYAVEKYSYSLLKADLNGFAGGCSEMNFNAGTVPVTPALVNKSINVVAGLVSITNAVNTVSDKPFTIWQTCKATSSCSFLKLIGPPAVCTNGTPVVFKGRRDPDCRLPVLWKMNGSPADISRFNDSTLSVGFQTSGHYQLIASLSSPCDEVIADTLNIEVTMSSQTALNLGPDRELCTGNMIVLNAHKGYFSYTWQDGSADSVFNVTSPGLYYVTTTDACGGVYKDSVTISAAPPIPFDVGPNRTKCNNDTIRLSAPSGFINYSWSPAYNISSTTASNVTVNPLADTSYYVKAEKTPGCFAFDTIRVTVYHAAAINLGADQSFCNGDSTLLDAGGGFSSYFWNGVSGSQYKPVYSTGEYSVIGITTEGCRLYDTVLTNVWSLPQVDLDHNNELCIGSTRILNPGNFSSYQWQDGSTNSTFTVNDTGTYYVQVTDNHNCVTSDTTFITKILALPHDFLPPDTAICTYSKVTLQSSQHFSSYLWYNGSWATTITVDKPGSYWLEVVDGNNCTGRDSIIVNPKPCTMGVYIPSAFTPDKDYKNDIFRAMVFGTVKKFELSVYNRWGQRVFYTADYSKGWDGSMNGVQQLSGGYVWTCRYLLEGGQETFDKGTIMLIR